MADDARISTALPRHPKTVKLERRLGAHGFRSLILLFLWVVENRPTGDLDGMSSEDIEIASTWPGDPGEFVRTLAEVRFLDGQEGAYKIHDWAEHNPWAANRPGRVQKARAAAGARWGMKPTGSEPGPNAVSMPSACHEHFLAMPTSPHLTSPHLTSPHKKKPSRPDEREPSDPRHSPLLELIKQQQRETIGSEQWDGRSAKALSQWLKANPGVSVEQSASLIANRFASAEPRGAPPWEWIPKLTKYSEGPLDKFGKTWEPDFRSGYDGIKAAK